MVKRKLETQGLKLVRRHGLLLLLISTSCFLIPCPVHSQVPAGTPVYRVNAQWVTDKGNQVYNVKAYGAVGDGVTDDTSSLQAAINAAQAGAWHSGAIVLLPKGIYAVSQTITFVANHSIIFQGTGNPSTTLKWIGASGGTVFQAKSVGWCVFDGFDIDGNSLASVAIDYTALNSVGGSQANRFRNIKVYGTIANTTTGAIHVGSSTNDQVSETTFDHVDMFVPTGGNGWYQEGGQCINNRYMNSLLSGAWNYGMLFVAGDVDVENVDFERQDGYSTVADVGIDWHADWVLLQHNYHEMHTVAAPAYAFLSGSRTWPSNVLNNIMTWGASSDFNIIDYEQSGALTVRGNTLYPALTSSTATIYVNSNPGNTMTDVDINQNFFYPNQVAVSVSGTAGRSVGLQPYKSSYGSIDFGAYKPVTAYRFISRSSGPAASGVVSFAYGDTLSFRCYSGLSDCLGLSMSATGYNVVQIGGTPGAATAGPFTINSGTAISKHLSATASLSPGAPGAVPGCSADVSLTVTGAAVGNTVYMGLPGSAVAGQVYSAWVDSTDTVKIRWCQLSGTAASPVSGTYRADVWQH